MLFCSQVAFFCLLKACCIGIMLRRWNAFFKKKQSKKQSSTYEHGAEIAEHMYNSSFTVTSFPRIHGTSAVLSVTIAEQDRCLSGSQDSNLLLNDITSGELLQCWNGHSKEITKVAYSPITDVYFSASRDKTVKIWKRGETFPVCQCIGHELVVTGVTVNKLGTLACTGSRDNTMRLWNCLTGSCIKKTPLAQNVITHVSWSNTSDMIAQSAEDKMVHIWDSRTLELVTSTMPKQHIQTWCDFSKDDRYFVSSSNGFSGNGCEATLWDARRVSQPICEFRGHYETVNACSFVTSGELYVATCSNDGTVRLWKPESGDCISVVTLPDAGSLTSLACDSKGQVVVSSAKAGIHLLSVLPSDDQNWRLVRTAEF